MIGRDGFQQGEIQISTSLFFSMLPHFQPRIQLKLFTDNSLDSLILKLKETFKLLRASHRDFKFYAFQGTIVESIEELHLMEKDSHIFFSPFNQDYDGRAALEAFEIQELLGEGGFGSVKKAFDLQTKQEVAIKFLKVGGIQSLERIQTIYKEAESLKILDHKYVIKLLYSIPIKSTDSLAIVMEYARGGELKKYLKKRGKLNEEETNKLFVQMIRAISYCHSRGIVHRDLKLENILFIEEEQLSIRIVDFGISGLCKSTYNKEKSQAGSLKYMAPEVLSGANLSPEPALDIWSLGCILYYLVYGHHPFSEQNKHAIMKKILYKEVKFLKEPQISNDCKELIRQMLEKSPSQRITMNEIMESKWFKFYEEEDKYNIESLCSDYSSSSPVLEIASPMIKDCSQQIIDLHDSSQQIENYFSVDAKTTLMEGKRWSDTQNLFKKYHNQPGFLQPIGLSKQEKQQRELLKRIFLSYQNSDNEGSNVLSSKNKQDVSITKMKKISLQNSPDSKLMHSKKLESLKKQ